jgi:hypothetical protein
MTVTDIALPEVLNASIGFLGAFAAADNPTSCALTRQRPGWEPVHPGLITDLGDGHYFA